MDFAFFDSSKVRRGGQVYIEKLAASLGQNGRHCTLIVCNGKERLGFLLYYLTLARYLFLEKTWLVGTAPSFLPIFVLSRYAVILIQSPIEEWSFQSRLLFRIAMKKKRRVVVCVSDYVKRGCGPKRAEENLVVYAQMEKDRVYSCSKEKTVRRGRQVYLALMNARAFDKGYLSAISLISHTCGFIELLVDVYGETKEDLSELEELCRCEVHGFVEEPFRDFAARRKGSKKAYLGLSHYEGLHMAVVEAALYGIPAILSDIPAHRELERLAGQQLMIGSRPRELVSKLRMLAEDDEYYESRVDLYRHMGNRFRRESELGVMELLNRIVVLEAQGRR